MAQLQQLLSMFGASKSNHREIYWVASEESSACGVWIRPQKLFEGGGGGGCQLHLAGWDAKCACLQSSVPTTGCSVNGSMPISACASVSMPPSPSSYQPQSVAIIQAAAKRCDVIVPHLRLGNGKYWLDVSSTNEFCE
jgi:hypothetical protein